MGVDKNGEAAGVGAPEHKGVESENWDGKAVSEDAASWWADGKGLGNPEEAGVVAKTDDVGSEVHSGPVGEDEGKGRGVRDKGGRPKGTRGPLFGAAYEGRVAKAEASIERERESALRDQKRILLDLTQREAGGESKLGRQIGRCLKTISLLYAAAASDGDEFRRNVALAVDLSGMKQEQAQKAKDKARKTASGKGARERAKMVEREHAPDDGKMRIETF